MSNSFTNFVMRCRVRGIHELPLARPYRPQHQQFIPASNLHGEIETVHRSAQIQVGSREFQALRVGQHLSGWGLAHATGSFAGVRFGICALFLSKKSVLILA
jgi:hypothetical protein